MLPETTEVYYRGQYGHVRFSDEKYMTICVKEHPQEKVRDVCLVVYPEDWHKVELVRGNNTREV